VRWHWSESRPGTMYLLAALLLELPPFEAALLLVTASDNHPIDAAAVPFWFAVGALAAACGAGHVLRGRPHSRALLLASPGIVVSYLLLVSVSPAARAGSRDPVTALGGLLAATCYLWVRGMAVGEGVPGADVVLRRFRNGLVALVVVILALPAIAVAERDALAGALTILLPADIFCGLVATSAARLVSQEGEARNSGPERPWLALSVFVAGLMVGTALLLGLALNGAALHAALRHMGPLGEALDAVASAVGQAVGTIAQVVLGGVFSLVPVGHITRPLQPVQPPSACSGAHCQQAVKPSVAFGVIVDVLLGLLAVVVLALVVYLAYRLVRRLASRPVPQMGIQEEREMLDGRAIFARQLRGLFGRRRGSGREQGEEALAPGTVRALYRDLLLAAAARGLPRRAAETPDEYAARIAAPPSPLATEVGTFNDDLAALTDAYNGARYGEREPDAGLRASLRQRLSRLIASLAYGR